MALALLGAVVAPAAADYAQPDKATGTSSFDTTPAVAAVRRLVPEQADRFTLEPMAKPDTGDSFSISGTAGAIKVRATSPATLLTGVGWYLRHVAKVDIGWPGDSLTKLPATLPAVNGTITQSAVVPHRYALNDTDDGYSGPYRDFASYQKMIDLLALHGVNEVFVQVGAEYPYYKALQQFGYTAEDLRKWIPKPAHQPWWLLQNMSGGPVSEKLINDRAELGAKVTGRLRELGMTPVLPGYFGTVPTDFAKRNAGAKVIGQGAWVGAYERPSWLDPADPVFTKVAAAYYKHQSDKFGNTTMYRMSPLHEGGTTGETDETKKDKIKRAAAKNIMEALQTAHPGAIWVLLGWQHSPEIPIIEGAENRDKLLIIDGLSDRYEKGDKTTDRDKGWKGAPYAFGTIDNFGGHTTIGGNTGEWVSRFADLRKTSKALKGIAYLPEGTGTNPVGFELFAELAWQSDRVDHKSWFAEYSARRYGGRDPHAEAAWELLRTGPYGTRADGWSEPQDSLFTARPGLEVTKAAKWSPETMRYDASTVDRALIELLKVSPDTQATDAYRFDLVNTARQALTNRSRVLLPQIKTAYDGKKPAEFRRLVTEWKKSMALLDNLLATDSRFLLGPWLESAKSLGDTAEEKKSLEHDARSVITTWADSERGSAELRDYANREWSGLVSDFYAVRWEKFFASLDAALADNTTPKSINWFEEVEDKWLRDRKVYPTKTVGDPVAVATEVSKTLQEPNPAPVPAPAGPITDSEGKCLDITDGNAADGTPLQLHKCNSTPAQVWTVATGSTVKAAGKCMEARGGATTAGTVVQLHKCNGTPAQSWTAEDDRTVKNKKSGLCLTAPTDNASPRPALTLRTCTGSAHQRWTLPSAANTRPGDTPPPGGFGPSDATAGATGGSTGGVGNCTDSRWDPGTIYTKGRLVSHNGAMWQAKWWTRNNEPGGPTAWGAWAKAGTC
ncbi:alpha-N-acetylglucosaminidase TIM-barrel domain-containing protein [Streptomyces sp. M41]|uniref:alpha-N-acetylglucosaminidase TIM-barrel domain-containing protein n=1 Tax=Streptomyces sp. M41 TaxID=3059412 RepID=UPI00374D3978